MCETATAHLFLRTTHTATTPGQEVVIQVSVASFSQSKRPSSDPPQIFRI